MPQSMPYLKRIHGVKGPGTEKLRAKRTVAPVRTEGMDDNEKRAYYDLCGDPDERARIAHRYSDLLAEYTVISLPEAVTYYLLEKRSEQFVFQQNAQGGRAILGGMVTDFLVTSRGYGLALQVQGDYWHNVPGARERDLRVIEELIGQTINGFTVQYVVELWESTLLGCNRDKAIDLALGGQGVGQNF